MMTIPTEVEQTDRAFAALTAACEMYAANPTDANRDAVTVANDMARFHAGLEVVL